MSSAFNSFRTSYIHEQAPFPRGPPSWYLYQPPMTSQSVTMTGGGWLSPPLPIYDNLWLFVCHQLLKNCWNINPNLNLLMSSDGIGHWWLTYQNNDDWVIRNLTWVTKHSVLYFIEHFVKSIYSLSFLSCLKECYIICILSFKLSSILSQLGTVLIWWRWWLHK